MDTRAFYGSAHNELRISEALKGRRREDYVLSVKFGALRIRPAVSSAMTRGPRR
jgi:pyridoxine 4-dehydrogenase